MREAIVAEARSWIGTPFHHQGFKKDVGTDCIGLIAGVALVFGIEGAAEWLADPNYHAYARQPDPKLLLRGCDRFLERIKLTELLRADILLMKFQVEPMHFALVSELDPMYVVHALARIGRVAEHRIDERWDGCIMRAYRYRGLA